jgi:hypothetical protein
MILVLLVYRIILPPKDEVSLIHDDEAEGVMCGDNREFYKYIKKLLGDAVPREKMLISKGSYDEIKSTYSNWLKSVSFKSLYPKGIEPQIEKGSKEVAREMAEEEANKENKKLRRATTAAFLKMTGIYSPSKSQRGENSAIEHNENPSRNQEFGTGPGDIAAEPDGDDGLEPQPPTGTAGEDSKHDVVDPYDRAAKDVNASAPSSSSSSRGLGGLEQLVPGQDERMYEAIIARGIDDEDDDHETETKSQGASNVNKQATNATVSRYSNLSPSKMADLHARRRTSSGGSSGTAGTCRDRNETWASTGEDDTLAASPPSKEVEMIERDVVTTWTGTVANRSTTLSPCDFNEEDFAEQTHNRSRGIKTPRARKRPSKSFNMAGLFGYSHVVDMVPVSPTSEKRIDEVDGISRGSSFRRSSIFSRRGSGTSNGNGARRRGSQDSTRSGSSQKSGKVNTLISLHICMSDNMYNYCMNRRNQLLHEP